MSNVRHTPGSCHSPIDVGRRGAGDVAAQSLERLTVRSSAAKRAGVVEVGVSVGPVRSALLLDQRIAPGERLHHGHGTVWGL